VILVVIIEDAIMLFLDKSIKNKICVILLLLIFLSSFVFQLFYLGYQDIKQKEAIKTEQKTN
jgi:hypothetical protein